jgi:S-formylglutathione hydrolase FrmB
MALCEIHLSSNNTLQKMTSFMAIVPEKMKGPFPVLYLLHGLSDDHTAWTRRTSLERYLDGLPLIVIMPDGERGWYTDAESIPHAKFESVITSDLIEFVDNTFPTIASREGRMTAGLSMGGYGAVKLAVKHPELFCGAVGFSGAYRDANDIDSSADWVAENRLIFGDSFSDGDNDVSALLRNADRSTIPALRLDCGTEDFLIEHNRQLHQLLESLQIEHEYMEFPGEHNWSYWDRGIVDALPFIKKTLKIE